MRKGMEKAASWQLLHGAGVSRTSKISARRSESVSPNAHKPLESLF